jgi:hypothetical protein
MMLKARLVAFIGVAAATLPGALGFPSGNQPSIRPITGDGTAVLKAVGATGGVFIFIATDCPLSNAYAPEIDRIYRLYHGVGVSFQSVYEDGQLTISQAEHHSKEYAYEFGGLLDSNHRFAFKLGAKVTPEAVVVSRSGKIVYRGRIDNTYASVAQRREVTTVRDLRLALDAVCKNEKVPHPQTKAIGCAIPPSN